MKAINQKYLIASLLALMFVLMLLSGISGGVSCDEMLHYGQSEAVYRYFASHGTDNSALITPVTHLKYYGQSYDNITTILTHWLGITDVYLFRNIMSSIAGWFVILITVLLAIRIEGFSTAVMVIFLFAVSPAFIGHSQNNLKDIPFALSYIAATYYIIRFTGDQNWRKWGIIAGLVLSIAFSMSIRAGGLVLICYLFFFTFLKYFTKWIIDREADIKEFLRVILLITFISAAAWMLSVILWPFALQSPVKNMLESYRVMAHFPSSFMQLFEGRVEWSDHMPWYYIPKSMLITIPLIVTAGFLLFLLFVPGKIRSSKAAAWLITGFTVIFPVLFVISEKSNLYSSWRQFLFIYPAFILLSASGLISLWKSMRTKIIRIVMVLIFLVSVFTPLKFMTGNLPYSYLYYNVITGGLRGAYGNYETDYYFVSQTEAAVWLRDYLRSKGTSGKVKIGASHPVGWIFSDMPEAETFYMRYIERSMTDWDYAIAVSRYVPPEQLKKGLWPPKNAIHVVYADKVPLCAILERRTKDDFEGYKALNEGRYAGACASYSKAVKIDADDEMIFYNFGAALYREGQFSKADSVLKLGLEINPSCEPLLMYLGNISVAAADTSSATAFYKRLLTVNRKYSEASVALSQLVMKHDVKEARSLLRECLKYEPGFKPALKALADTYRLTAPDVARKYDEIYEQMK